MRAVDPQALGAISTPYPFSAAQISGLPLLMEWFIFSVVKYDIHLPRVMKAISEL